MSEREKALEDAAKVCEDYVWQCVNFKAPLQAAAAKSLAYQIRALKDSDSQLKTEGDDIGRIRRAAWAKRAQLNAAGESEG